MASVAFHDLPNELVDLIFSALPLHALVPVRVVCSSFRARIQRRFLPIVMPPECVDDDIASLAPSYFIGMFASYLQWLREWWRIWDAAHPERGRRVVAKLKELRSIDDPTAGFYSLAPWWRAYGETVPEPWEQEGWLHEALYAADSQSPMSSRELPRSRFYQRRTRNDDDAFRTFYTTPAEAWPFRNARDAEPETRHIVLAPLNVRRLTPVEALIAANCG